jgi:hypothetical protein
MGILTLYAKTKTVHASKYIIFNILANSQPISKIFQVVNQELMWVLLAKRVEIFKKFKLPFRISKGC